MVEGNFALYVLQGSCVRQVPDFRRRVQHGQHTLRSGHGLLHVLQQVGQAGDRSVEKAQVQQEGHDVRRAQAFLIGQVAAEAHYQDRADGGKELHGRMEDAAELQGLQHGLDVFKVMLVYLFCFIFLPAEGLDLMNAGEVVLEFAVEFAHFLLGNPEEGADFFGEDDAGKEDEGDRRAGDQRQLPVDGQQHDEYAGESDQVGDGFRDHVGVEQLKVPGVIDDPAHQVAGLLVVEIAQVHMLQLVIGPGAQVAHQVPGSLMGQVVAEEAEEDPQQVQGYQRRGHQADGMQSLLGQAFLHQSCHGGEQLRRGQVDCRQGQGGQNRDNIQRPVSDGFTTEPPQGLDHLLPPVKSIHNS